MIVIGLKICTQSLAKSVECGLKIFNFRSWDGVGQSAQKCFKFCLSTFSSQIFPKNLKKLKLSKQNAQVGWSLDQNFKKSPLKVPTCSPAPVCLLLLTRRNPIYLKIICKPHQISRIFTGVKMCIDP